MLWFEGSITAAITAAKQRNVLFVVYVRGDDEVSTQMDATWEDEGVTKLCIESAMVAIKFNANSDECKQFSQYYPVICVPCVSFISGETGVPLEGAAGHMSPTDFKLRIQKVLEMAKQGSSPTSAAQTPARTSSPATAPQPTAAGQSLSPTTQAPAPAQSPAQTPAPAPAQSPAQTPAPATSQGQQKELSKLEKAARLRQKMEEIHQRKEAQKEEGLRRKEMERRNVGQAVQMSMQERSDQEARKVAEEMRKEKEEDRRAKERVREQIARDRVEKQSRYETDRKAREMTQAAAKEAAKAAGEAPKRKINMFKGKSRKAGKKPGHRKHGTRYQCPHCVNRYDARGSLRRHLKIEHGPKVFSWCRRCEFKCNRRDNLRRHYKQYHTQHMRDLEAIALETLEQKESRLQLESAERRAATSKPKGSKKRKTGKRTWIAIGRSLRRKLGPASSCDDLFGNEPVHPGNPNQPSVHEGSEDCLDGMEPGENIWVPVKIEPGETPQLPPSPKPSCSSGPVPQDLDDSPAWLGQQTEYSVGGLFQCPKCIMNYQQASSLRRHLQEEHGPRAFFWCRHCKFRSKRRDNLRRHYRSMHSRHMVEVHVMRSETRDQKERREQQELGEETEAAPGQDQRASLLQSSRGSDSSFHFEPLERGGQLPEHSEGSSPDASAMETMQPTEAVHGDDNGISVVMATYLEGLAGLGIPSLPQAPSLPAEETFHETGLAISHEAVSAVDPVLFPAQEQPSSSKQLPGSDNHSDAFLMTCSSVPVSAPDNRQDSSGWQAPLGYREVGCEEVDLFKCPKCNNEYLQLGSLNRHLRIDHGPQVFFWCRHCDFRANRKDNFRRHYRQVHCQHEGEVKAISIETREQKEIRERQEGIKGNKQTKPPVPEACRKGRKDAVETTASVARNVGEEAQSLGMSLSQRSEGESSVSSLVSPRVELVKIVFPGQLPRASDAAPLAECDSSPGASDSVIPPQRNPTGSAAGDSRKSPQGNAANGSARNLLPTPQRRATPNVAQDSLETPQRGVTRVAHGSAGSGEGSVAHSVASNKFRSKQRFVSPKDVLASQQKHTTRNEIPDSLNSSQGNTRRYLFQDSLQSSRGNAAPKSGSFTFHQENQRIRNRQAVRNLLTSTRRNAAYNAFEDSVNVSERNVTCDKTHNLLDPTQRSVARTCACSGDTSHEGLPNSPLSNVTRHSGDDLPNLPQSNAARHSRHSGYDLPNSPESNVTHHTGRDLPNSPQSNATRNTGNNFPNAPCHNLAKTAAGNVLNLPLGRATAGAAQQESPVTSTSEGPSIPLTRLEEVLRGKVTRVVEESHTVVYRDGTRVKEETVKRTYEVEFQADFGNGTVTPI